VTVTQHLIPNNDPSVSDAAEADEAKGEGQQQQQEEEEEEEEEEEDIDPEQIFQHVMNEIRSKVKRECGIV